MTIGVWAYLDEYEEEKTDILKAFEKVAGSGRLMFGPSSAAFEKEFSTYCETQFGIGVDNGTNSITLSLLALGLNPGDEVITVSNTAVPTVCAIVNAGCIPRFVDIDPNTFLMSLEKLEEAIRPKTKCIVPVHLYGQCVDMDLLTEIAKSHDIKILEDCAQAHGALYKGRKAGGLGDVGSFSFYPTKILGAYGDGGMITCNDPKIESVIRQLKFYGMKGRYFAETQGFNSRLDEVQAEILRFKLKKLDNYLEKRKQIAHFYDQQLSSIESLQTPIIEAHNSHAYYLYVVRHKQRDRIIEKLREFDINLNVSYPWPIHTMPPYKTYSQDQPLIETEKASKEIFSLPMYPSLKSKDMHKVVEHIAKVIKEL
ncbi:MAG: DegT/DnrJ/EryC1/StrS family aminotransferase [Pseudobacteriovorax sp.]|nr:DegT/DnrJ/EryC1/StrS family aminotransferase [Pseudobacteriovorax sp.]